MKPEPLCEALEQAAAAAGLRVRYESLGPSGVGSSGGVCRVRGEWWVIIDKKAAVAEKVAILADALAGMDLEGVVLAPKVREVIEARRAPGRAAAAG
jgi:hypothetical protein